MKRLFLLLFAGSLLFSLSCRHKLEKTSWEVDVLAPLVKTTLSIDNIVADSTLQINADNSISIVYQQTLYDYNLASFIQPYDTTIERTFKIDSLSLAKKSLTFTYSLGDIANNVGPAGTLIILNNLKMLTILPISGIALSDIDVSAQDFFETATLKTGFMDIEIKNELPTDVANVRFEFSNKVQGNVLIRDTFPLILSGTSMKQTYDLSGKTVEGSLVAKIVNLDVVGTVSPVLIDTSKALIITLTVYDLTVFKATAIFPAQDLINDKNHEVLEMDSLKFTRMRIKSGFIKTEIYSTAEDTVYFTFALPGAIKNGQSFKKVVKADPAPPNGTTHVNLFHDFSGYDVDLTGSDGSKLNYLYRELSVRIDSTGKTVTLSLQDSFRVIMGIVQLVPDYAVGYFGQDTVNVGPASVDIDVFDAVKSGTIDLENVIMSLEIDNGLGLDGTIEFKNIEAVNTKDAKSKTLTYSGVTMPFPITGATDNPLTSSKNVIILDNSNSNSNELISLLPDKFNYELTLTTNPAGYTLNNFGYASSNLSTNLNIEIPLSFISDKLKLSTVAKFSLDQIKKPEKLKDGTLRLIVDHGFPLDAYIDLYLLNKSGNIIDSLISPMVIKAASLNGSGKVDTKRQTILVYIISKNKMAKLLQTKQIRFNIEFSTVPANTYVKIYSDYSSDLKLTGDFNFLIDGFD
ncbi:MAG: hypothetical protein IIA45_15440 [Bacteroidetes bacterium]|nr:hypothetical protein [Bacteroidota bacterium]